MTATREQLERLSAATLALEAANDRLRVAIADVEVKKTAAEKVIREVREAIR